MVLCFWVEWEKKTPHGDGLFFLFAVSSWGTHLFFHLSDLLQIPNNCRMVDVELFGNFLCSCERISFDDCSYLVVVDIWWLATTLLIFKAVVSLAKLLEPPLHCSSWAKGIVDVLSCPHCFMTRPMVNSNKKITQISFLSSIISVV